MTQHECLSLASHWTHEGVCYPGSNATIQLHGITIGGTTGVSVPEPGTAGLLALALLLGVLSLRMRPRGGTWLGYPFTS